MHAVDNLQLEDISRREQERVLVFIFCLYSTFTQACRSFMTQAYKAKEKRRDENGQKKGKRVNYN